MKPMKEISKTVLEAVSLYPKGCTVSDIFSLTDIERKLISNSLESLVRYKYITKSGLGRKALYFISENKPITEEAVSNAWKEAKSIPAPTPIQTTTSPQTQLSIFSIDNLITHCESLAAEVARLRRENQDLKNCIDSWAHALARQRSFPWQPTLNKTTTNTKELNKWKN